MSGIALDVRVEGRLGCLRLASGDSPATLDGPSLARILEAVQTLVQDPRVERLVVRGVPGYFVAGVDVSFFLACLRAGQVERILAFTREAQQVLQVVARCPKPVIAWVDGPTYGGGLELALACHRIVAGPKAKFCFPETGLGIYPGMGGTQRLPRRIGVGLAKWMIYTGAIVPVDHAAHIGLIDAEVSGDASAEVAVAALDTSRDFQTLDPRFRGLAELFSQRSVESLLSPSLPMPTDPQAVRAVIQARAAAPQALRLAEAAIDRGIALPLDAGLQEEFAHLAEVFSTSDAMTGLSALGKAKPKFTGTNLTEATRT